MDEFVDKLTLKRKLEISIIYDFKEVSKNLSEINRELSFNAKFIEKEELDNLNIDIKNIEELEEKINKITNTLEFLKTRIKKEKKEMIELNQLTQDGLLKFD